MKLRERWKAALFHNLNLLRNIQRLRRQTHRIIAGLIAQFAGESRGSGRGAGGRLKVRHDLEIAGEHRQWLFREAVFFHARLREGEAGNLQRSGIPGEPQRNQVFVRGRIAVDVVTRAQVQRQHGIDHRAWLRNHLARRREVKDVALRERLRP